jgi:hypothetical protein
MAFVPPLTSSCDRLHRRSVGQAGLVHIGRFPYSTPYLSLRVPRIVLVYAASGRAAWVAASVRLRTPSFERIRLT